eukprot:TRINITY_DN20747_c0_g1_i1.p1 TRINITY_DN20747_c0_g1~~TRINITY_DN20747_c0_g1_i1.p1  ORF type:complete len:245 (+),score=67.04 TRINITY_DN20747_c0_g1_i1:57-737(+)
MESFKQAPGWVKALVLAGGAAATGGILWYLFRDDESEESGPSEVVSHKLPGRQLFQVTDPKGCAIGIRAEPDTESEKTGMRLFPGQVFEVTEVVEGAAPQLYLKLADGIGWVFTHSSRDGRLLCQPISEEDAEAAQQQQGMAQMMQEMAMMLQKDPELAAQVMGSPQVQQMMQDPAALQRAAMESQNVAQALGQTPDLQQAVTNDPAALAEALRMAMGGPGPAAAP